MSAKKTIAIIGATGTQGGSVARTFLALPNWHVRALTRNTNSAGAVALSKAGAEVVPADLDSPSSLAAAFAGAHAIFVVTGYWTIFGDETRSHPAEKTRSVWAFDVEVQQAKNAFEAASRVPTLERLVWSSLAYIGKLTNGKFKHAYHFDSKGLATDWLRETLPALWAKTSVLQVGFYLENFVEHIIFKPKKNGQTGVYEFGYFPGDRALPLVCAAEDTGPLTKLLIEGEPGKNLAGLRQNMRVSELVEIINMVSGLQAAARESLEFPDPVFKQRMEDNVGGFKQVGYFGEKADKTVITPVEVDPSFKLPSVEDWVKKQDWTKILNVDVAGK